MSNKKIVEREAKYISLTHSEQRQKYISLTHSEQRQNIYL